MKVNTPLYVNGLVAIVLSGLATEAFSQPGTCESECSKDASAYCLDVPSLVAGPDIPWALRNLYPFTSRIVSGGALKPDQLLGFFGMTANEDPCGRGETTFNAGRLKNSGTFACQITVLGPSLAGGKNIKLGFDVPIEMTSEVRKENDDIVFEFSQNAASAIPEFWIDDEDLNSDWGGKLRRVTYSPKKVVVTTENGCIRYQYP